MCDRSDAVRPPLTASLSGSDHRREPEVLALVASPEGGVRTPLGVSELISYTSALSLGTGSRIFLNPAWGSEAMGRGCKRCGAAGAGSASLSSLGIGARRCSLWNSLVYLGCVHLCLERRASTLVQHACGSGRRWLQDSNQIPCLCMRFGPREQAPRRGTCGCGRCLPQYSAQIPCLCAHALILWVGTGQCGISTLRKGKVAAHRVEDGCGAPATLALGRHSVDHWCSATYP